MLIILSPAKTLSFDDASLASTSPLLLESSATLIELLRAYSTPELMTLMKLSESLGALNVARYQAWRGAGEHAALDVFRGGVYQGLNALTLSSEMREHAQRHLRILSGLYGVLRPLDAIEPHRLEMGTRLSNARGAHLYAHWGDRLLDLIERDLTAARRVDAPEVIVNLASREYFKSLKRPRGFKCRVISPVFKERRGEQLKVISVSAKRARGLMTRHLLERSYAEPTLNIDELLSSFTVSGYVYTPEMSAPDTPLFIKA